MRTLIGGVLAAALVAPAAFAQSSPGTWNGLPDRFQIDTGYFHLNANTLLRYNGPQGGSGEIDFEEDLGLPQMVDTFWVDGRWRVGRRHQLQLGFTRLTRDRGDFVLDRTFTWGGQTYNAGLSATTTSGSDILGGYYRFAIFRNDRFEIGPRSASATYGSTPGSRPRAPSAGPAGRRAGRSTRARAPAASRGPSAATRKPGPPGGS
jgi:hypothetical protein